MCAWHCEHVCVCVSGCGIMCDHGVCECVFVSVACTNVHIPLLLLEALQIPAQPLLHLFIRDCGHKRVEVLLSVGAKTVQGGLAEEPLGDGPCIGIDLCPLLCRIDSTVHDVTLGHDLIHQANAQCLAGRHHLAQLQQTLRVPVAHRVDHGVDEEAGSHNAKLGLVQADSILALSHDPIVTGEGQHASTGRRMAVDSSNEGQVGAVETQPLLLDGSPERPDTGRVGLVHLKKVQPGTEHTALLGPHNHGTHRLVRFDLIKRIHHLSQQLCVERVHGFSVQVDAGHTITSMLHSHKLAREASPGRKKPKTKGAPDRRNVREGGKCACHEHGG
eukprot:comp12607_c0_seq1/m.7642 comp12607_c0_seq1/g.7642  ORF comp12607_c0_seq1/g.7642 comp12607_c0_seq1/m.7642 type:complete len:331 (+) comp12607_c0_seq1:429-1421(+)